MTVKHTFHKGDLFWAEASLLVQAIVSRWKLIHKAQRLLVGDAELLGKFCPCVRLENTSRHEHMVKTGEFNESCTFVECAPSCGRPDVTFLFDDIFVIRLEQIVFGHAFQIAGDIADKKWSGCSQWPATLRVGRHLRNGAFHGNRFFFQGREPVGEPRWRDLHITRALAGRTVFGHSDGVVSLGDVPVLLSDMMRELNTAPVAIAAHKTTEEGPRAPRRPLTPTAL